MGWVVNARPRPLYTRNYQAPIVQETAWAAGRVPKIQPLPGFDLRTKQPVASRVTDCAFPAFYLFKHNTDNCRYTV